MARYTVHVPGGYGSGVGGITGLAGDTSVTWAHLDGTPIPGVVPTMHELDPVNAPGVYYFDETLVKDAVATVDMDTDDSEYLDTYRFHTVLIVQSSGGVGADPWDADLASYNTQGKFGFEFRVLMGLAAHKNMRIKPITFDRGRMTECQLVVYATKADADADSNPIATVDQVSVLDTSSPPKLQSFKSTE